MDKRNNKYRIMHLIATNFYGGPEKQIVEHLKRVDKTIFSGVLGSYIENGSQNEILERAEAEAIENYGIHINGLFDTRSFKGLRNLLITQNIDLLCTHGFKSTVIGWMAARVSKIPIISFSRGYTAENKKVAFYEWIERRVIGRVDGVICVSAGQKRKLNSLGVNPVRVWVVHNSTSVSTVDIGSDVKELRKEICSRFNVPPECFLVVAAGRLSPEKGHRYLIEAISILKEKVSNVYFVICGDGQCRDELIEQAEKLGIMHLCRFPGFRRDINEIHKSMDLMVLPSLTEGLPNVVLEAFSYAKAVVATSVGGVPEIVEDGVNGILVAPQQPLLLAEALARLIQEQELCTAMGQAGYRTVASRFTFEQQTKVLEEIYKSILELD